MTEPLLSVVVPAYNEEARLDFSLKQICSFLRKQPYASEVIFVDDGSTDRTVALAKRELAGFPHTILKNETNRGKGSAVRKGMLAAKGKFVLFTDADLSTPIEEAASFLRSLQGDYDVVIGSRALDESKVEVHQAFLREFMGKIFNRLARLLTFHKIRDSQCGFKGFRREAARELFSAQKMDGFSFDVEIVYLAQRKGLRILEAPVTWRNSPQSRVRLLGDPVRMFWDLVRIRWIHNSYGWLLAIGLLAFALRVAGIHFGLPHLYHADEPIVVNHALSYGTGDLNPHYFKLPPLMSYILFLLYGFYFVGMFLLGKVHSAADFQALFLTDPTGFYFLGRFVLGAFLGTLTVVVFYRLIERFFSKRLAIGAGLLFAVNFLHVQNSHYIYLDMPLLLVLTASFFPILKILKGGERKDYILFGVLLGLAVGTKYNGFFILFPFLAAHAIFKGRKFFEYIDKNIIFAAVVSLLTFFAVNPFALLDYFAFTRDIFSMHEFEGRQGWTHHFVYSLAGAFGYPALLFAGAGMLALVFRFQKERFVLFSFAAAYYCVLTQFSEQHDRYILPLVPWICFFAADGCERLTANFPKRNFFYALGLMIAMLPSLAKDYDCTRLFLAEDIRTTALRWAEEHLPEGSKIAFDSPFFMPRLKPTLAQLEAKQAEAAQYPGTANRRRLNWLVEQAKNRPAKRYELFYLSREKGSEFLFAKPVISYDLEGLQRAGIRYVFMGRYHEGHEPEFLRELETHATLLKRFSPYRDPQRKWPVSQRPLTALPFVWPELTARTQNGQIIDLYQISD